MTPLQIGAPDIAFPRLVYAFHFFFWGGVVISSWTFHSGGAAKSDGRVLPLATVADLNNFIDGQTLAG